MRYHHRAHETLVPRVTASQRELKKTVEFIRLAVPVIAKEEADSQIDARQGEKPGTFRCRLTSIHFPNLSAAAASSKPCSRNFESYLGLNPRAYSACGRQLELREGRASAEPRGLRWRPSGDRSRACER